MHRISRVDCEYPINRHPRLIQLSGWRPPRGFVKTYNMPHWSLHFLHYRMRVDIEGDPHVVKPGYALLTPPGVETRSHNPGGHSHYFAHFVHDEAGAQDMRMVKAPLVLDMADEYESLNRIFAKAAQSVAHDPTRAEVLLWQMLYELYDKPLVDVTAGLPHQLVNAITFINENISVAFRISQVARYAQVSSRHLNRLFQQHFGMTTAAYIREQRLMEAKKYLETSDYKISDIAEEVGIPDANQFSKLVRKRFGATPTALRRQAR